MTEARPARAAARLALGRTLRSHRQDAGMTGLEAAGRLGWSQSKVSRIEAARTRAEIADIARLLDLYGVPEPLRGTAMRLAEEAAGPPSEWRNSTRIGLPRRQQDFVAFEAAASGILHYQPMLIPGPLQTPAYAARVLTMVSHPDPDRAIATRQARQSAIFGEDGPSVCVVLTDQAVHWNPGPAGVLAEQLRSMASLIERSGADLRVVPLDVEQRTFLAHPVVIYDFVDQDPQAMVETTTQDIRVTDTNDVARLRSRIDTLSKVALNRADSIEYVRKVATRSIRRRRAHE